MIRAAFRIAFGIPLAALALTAFLVALLVEWFDDLSLARRNLPVMIAITLLAAARPANADDALARVDLLDANGAAQVGAEWHYSDASVVPEKFRAPDAQGQPGDTVNDTQGIEPRAGRTEFDDSAWPVIAPESLKDRRGTGRVSFNWYRVKFTLPEP